MSNELNQNDNDSDEFEMPDELTLLKQRADMMGLKYHPSIGLDSLKAKVNEAIKESPPIDSAPVGATPKTAAQLKTDEAIRVKREAMKLVRVRVTCMNPNKKEWEGEFITVGNSVMPTIRRYVHFGEIWHVEQFILNVLQDKKFQMFYTEKLPNGQKVRKGKLTKEFAIEILPNLSEDELHDLAQRQAMANGTA